MRIEIKVPPLPESVNDATVLDWHVQLGEQVKRDQNLVDLETDKVVLEVPAPADGQLAEIAVQSGEVVQAGQLLAVLEPLPAATTQETAKETETAKAVTKESVSEPVLSPSVRKLLRELNLDPKQIKGSGKGGRILKSDINAYLDQQKKKSPEQAEQQALQSLNNEQRLEKRVPMSRLRATIAQRLLEAQQQAAILTTFNEVDLQQVIDLRQQFQEEFKQKHGIKLGFMSFFVKASIEALKKFPIINASVEGQEIIYHSYYDIGIAIGSPRGLVVPILRNADQLSFAEIEKQIKSYAQKAQDGHLSYEDLQGGTFTISNGGVYGSMLSTPILNPPQSAILGMHSIMQRPVVVAGEMVIRPMMYLALSYDHRIIDGKEAVQFLVTIKEVLQQPSRLLLDLS